MNSDILIVVAALDEADRIRSTLAALELAFPGAPVWVADDGSTDATPELARAAGATVVRSERGAPRRHGGVGKGQAMTAGVRAALASIDFLDVNARARVDVDSVDSPRGPRGGPRGSRGSRGDLEESSRGPRGDLANSSRDPRRAKSLADPVSEPVLLLCDGDLGDCARELSTLVDALGRSDADLAVAAFATRVGGGFGLALAFARWAIRRRCGLATRAPISGQRALRAGVARDVLPFAPGFGMEIGMTIDAVRAGHRVVEVDLDLAHRATGRTLAGFLHRARQLVDFVRVYLARR
jgi:glycosyltransferase involved in cell wall biosynthesis